MAFFFFSNPTSTYAVEVGLSSTYPPLRHGGRSTHGPGIDEPISVEKNGQKYYYISDGLGSMTQIVDSSGEIVAQYRYDSFGNILNSSETLSQPYTYTGREYDPETGLFYYRNRYYEAKTGRFLQEDPLGLAGGINYYSYVGNDPINFKDPLGLIWVTVNVDYHGTKNWLKWFFINRGTVKREGGVDQRTIYGSNPDEYIGMTRDVTQEWRPDPNNSCLDSMYPYGTERIVSQSFDVHLAGRNEIANTNEDGLFYQWDPWVNSPTYKNFANQQIIYSQDRSRLTNIYIKQILGGRNGR